MEQWVEADTVLWCVLEKNLDCCEWRIKGNFHSSEEENYRESLSLRDYLSGHEQNIGEI